MVIAVNEGYGDMLLSKLNLADGVDAISSSSDSFTLFRDGESYRYAPKIQISNYKGTARVKYFSGRNAVNSSYVIVYTSKNPVEKMTSAEWSEIVRRLKTRHIGRFLK